MSVSALLLGCVALVRVVTTLQRDRLFSVNRTSANKSSVYRIGPLSGPKPNLSIISAYYHIPPLNVFTIRIIRGECKIKQRSPLLEGKAIGKRTGTDTTYLINESTQ